MSEHADKVLAAIEADDTSSVAASWRRSRRLYGLDPDRALPPERDAVGWREAYERDFQLISVAQPYLDELYRLLADADCGVFLADRIGMMLALRTNRRCDSFERPPEACLGTIYSERLLGTNSMGTCIAEQRGVTLRGGQHYLSHYAHLVCVAAPLFGPEGDLIGCLALNQNVKAHDARLDAFLSISVAGFAQRIESELFALAFPKARLMLASPTGRRPDALLAVDPDHCVLGATRGARRLLDLTDEAIAETVAVEQLMEQQADAAGRLADAERRVIERTLARCGGNISAAAKSIGISRSTLYRKMASYAVPPSGR